MLDMQDFKKIIDVDQPLCSCIIPGKYKNQAKFEEALDDYENQLQEETLKPFVNSGHAFVCFDSVSSLNAILKHFRTTPWQNVKIFFISVFDKFRGFGQWLTGRDQQT